MRVQVPPITPQIIIFMEVLFKMSRTIKSVLHYETRINKLQNNGKDNGRIIKKLERQLHAAHKLAKEESK